MGALPKNKITRVEQGKRRRGNSPKLKKDAHAAVPNHKQGFVAELMRFIGLDKTAVKATSAETKVEATTEVTAAAKSAKAKSQAGTKANQASTKVNTAAKVAAPKVRKTVAKSGK